MTTVTVKGVGEATFNDVVNSMEDVLFQHYPDNVTHTKLETEMGKSNYTIGVVVKHLIELNKVDKASEGVYRLRAIRYEQIRKRKEQEMFFND